MTERENSPVVIAAQNLVVPTSQRFSLVGRGLAALLKDNDSLYRQARVVFDRLEGSRHWNANNPDLFAAFKIFQRLADENYGKAYYPLAILYSGLRDIEYGEGPARYYTQLAFEWCMTNQANVDAEIGCDLGEMYQFGHGVERDGEVAECWYRKAAEQGYARGQWALGCFLTFDDKDHPGSDWMEQAAKQGNAHYQTTLAAAYEALLSQYQKAVYWYRKAAEGGDAEGQWQLGRMYKVGLGVEQDYEQAMYWFHKAAEQGNAVGQWMLGEMYANGHGVAQDNEQAEYWFRKSAEQDGWGSHQNNLGEMYVLGRGVEQDNEQAEYWFRKSAEQDDADAQFNLGEMYKQGYGIEQDDEKAVYWFRKAAEQGRDFAQYSLAKMYQYGRGVGQDDEQAVYWYRKAREQDDGVTKWNFDYNGGWRFNCDHWGRRFPHSPRTIDFPYETAPQDMVVMLSHTGYIKAQLLADHLAQPAYSEGINRIFIASSADYILCFSDRGRVYWTNVYEVPPGNHISRGLQLEDGEKIIATLPVKEFDDKHFIFMATSSGIVKKAPLTDFSRPMKRGIVAINLDEDDFLIGAAITDGQRDIMLFSDDGKAVRFEEGDVRETGRNSRGVFGMRLCEGQKVISLLVGEDDDEIVLITNTDRMVRTSVKEIRGMGRATQGVTLIHLSENEKLSGLDKLMKPIVRE